MSIYVEPPPGVSEAALSGLETRVNEIPAVPTFVVAASNASAHVKNNADFVCDGTADEVQINEAQAALPSIGGRLLLSEGIFTLAAPVVVDKDNVSLSGLSKGQPLGGPNPTKGGTLLLRGAGFTGTEAIKVNPAAADRVLFGVALEDFSLDGMALAGAVDGILWRAARSTIRNVWVTRWAGNGLVPESNTFGTYPKASHDNLFDSVRVDDCTLNGMKFVNGSTDNLIRNCIVTSNELDGIAFSTGETPSTANMLIGSYIYSNEGKAVSGPAYQTQIVGNRLQDCNGGIYLAGVAGAAGFQIVGNHIRDCSNAADNTTDGINVTATGVCRGGLISDNAFHTDPGDQNPSLRKMRYGINIASANVHNVVVGVQGQGYREATATFGTGMLNDEGVNTTVLNSDQVRLSATGANAQSTLSSYGSGQISTSLVQSARGTAEAPLRTKSSDTIGRWVAGGAQAATDEAAAAFATSFRAIIRALATEDWTSAAQGASLIFETTTTGSLTTNEKFRLNGGEGIDFQQGSFATYMMRLKNNSTVMGRNAANNANVSLLKINASDQLELMSDVFFAASKKLGFFGKTPATRPNVKAPAEVTAKELCEALETLGLIE